MPLPTASLLPVDLVREAVAATLAWDGRAALGFGAGGGFFLWVILPDGADAGALLERAEVEGLGYLPGECFALPGGPVAPGALRAACCGHAPDVLRETRPAPGTRAVRVPSRPRKGPLISITAPLGRTGAEISRVGLGTWQLGGPGSPRG